MVLSTVINYLEDIAPLSYQEAYDNAGLIVGTPTQEVKGAIISLDCTEDVIDEAIQHHCNLIISHHPIVFKGMKRFNGSTYIERVVMKAIKHDIAIYAIHTNLDNVDRGVNKKIADRLQLQNCTVLSPKADMLNKLVVFVPKSHGEALRAALFEAGGGAIGQYSECSFNLTGKGTFKAQQGAKPFVGHVGERHTEEEERIELIYPKAIERKLLIAMYEHHPYEEVAYDIYPLQNKFEHVGSGMIGNLSLPQTEQAFLAYL